MHAYVLSYVDSCRIHFDAMNKGRAKTLLLEKYTSHFIWKGCVCERELETEQNCNILTPHSYGHQRCCFLVLLGCSTGSPGAQLSAGFLYHILSPTHLISNSDFLSSPSYIIVQSPTQSLEWHVWSSSNGNNCHAVHRSLSSGASIYECTMGFLPCPIFFSAKPTYAISSHNCHRNVSLPSGASLWNGMFGRVEGQYTTNTNTIKQVYIKEKM